MAPPTATGSADAVESPFPCTAAWFEALGNEYPTDEKMARLVEAFSADTIAYLEENITPTKSLEDQRNALAQMATDLPGHSADSGQVLPVDLDKAVPAELFVVPRLNGGPLLYVRYVDENWHSLAVPMFPPGESQAVAAALNMRPASADARDVTGDGQPEALVTHTFSGGSNWREHLQVLRWNGTGFDVLFRAELVNWAGFSTWALEPDPGGGLMVHLAYPVFLPGRYPKASINPQGEQFWRWDDTAGHYRLAWQIVGPSPLKGVAELDRAEEAMATGDCERAISLYEAFLADEAWHRSFLQHYGSETGTVGQQELAAWQDLARLRLGLCLALTGHSKEAQSALGEIEETEPLAELAQAFRAGYSRTGDLLAGLAAYERRLAAGPNEKSLRRQDISAAVYHTFQPQPLLVLSALSQVGPERLAARLEAIAPPLARPTVTDLDGDGALEVIWLSPPAWHTFTPNETPVSNWQQAWVACHDGGRWQATGIAAADQIELLGLTAPDRQGQQGIQLQLIDTGSSRRLTLFWDGETRRPWAPDQPLDWPVVGSWDNVGTQTAEATATSTPTSRPTANLTTRLVSVTANGRLDRRAKGAVQISGDGRYVVYLVALGQIYLRDLQTGTATPVTAAPSGAPADNWSFAPSISADGRTVAFFSAASNLVEDAYQECPLAESGEPEPCGSLYLYDAASGGLERIPVAAAFSTGLDTALSADGRYAAFSTPQAFLREGVFLYDRATKAITPISLGDVSDPLTFNSGGGAVDISADGRYVAFASWDDDVVPGDNDGESDVFVYDRDTGQIERISAPIDGSESGGPSGFHSIPNTGGASERGLSISADGRYMAFMSTAPNLVARDLVPCQHWSWTDEFPACRHIYLYDRETGTMELISVSGDGTPGNRASEDADVSADGRWVVFTSLADNLTVDGSTRCNYYAGICPQVYVRDREGGQTYLVSRGWDGQPADAQSSDGVITPDGHHVAFISGAGNLVPDVPFSQNRHVFVTDLSISTPDELPASPRAVPTPTPVLEGMEEYTWSSVSPDGQWIVQGLAAFPKTGDDYYTQLQVLRADGSIERTVVDEWSHLGLGYTTPRVFHWSQNGRYLYFTNEPVPNGCAVFVNGSDLWKIDLADGSVTQVVPHVGLWLSLSPDETTLAYIGYGDRGLVLRDLTTSVEREVKLDPGQEYSAGQITWSPDGKTIMLTLALRPCSKDWAAATSIVRVEVETLEQTTLIDQDSHLFTILEWPTVERVLVVDRDSDYWWMDTTTGHLQRLIDLPPSTQVGDG